MKTASVSNYENNDDDYYYYLTTRFSTGCGFSFTSTATGRRFFLILFTFIFCL